MLLLKSKFICTRTGDHDLIHTWLLACIYEVLPVSRLHPRSVHHPQHLKYCTRFPSLEVPSLEGGKGEGPVRSDCSRWGVMRGTGLQRTEGVPQPLGLLSCLFLAAPYHQEKPKQRGVTRCEQVKVGYRPYWSMAAYNEHIFNSIKQTNESAMDGLLHERKFVWCWMGYTRSGLCWVTWGNVHVRVWVGF